MQNLYGGVSKRLVFALLPFIAAYNAHAGPQVAVVFVIDQCAYWQMPKLAKFLDGGIGAILKNGSQFISAYVPNGIPSTAPGHTGLSTGVAARFNGIVENDWFDADGKEIDAFDDQTPRSIMVDSVNKYVCNQTTGRTCWSFSYKDRAAIGMAGKEGTAIWFDDEPDKNQFITSQYYLKKLPDWLAHFNSTHRLYTDDVSWHLAYPHQHARYNFPLIDNYAYASPTEKGAAPGSLITTLAHRTKDGSDIRKLFEYTPATDQLVIDAAFAHIQDAFKKDKDARLLVWISLSSLDKIGHKWGPESREAIDTIYHMDKQIQTFRKKLERLMRGHGLKQSPLYVLTADHGVMPIPELHGHRRIMRSDIKKTANSVIEKTYGIKDIVNQFTGQYMYLDKNKLSPEIKDAVIETIADAVGQVPGVKNAYPVERLKREYPEGSPLWRLSNSFYEGRSGDIFVLVDEGALITKYPTGTGHSSIYDYDTHVPLAIWWPGHIEQATIKQHVWSPQLANTLAWILEDQTMPHAMARLPLA